MDFKVIILSELTLTDLLGRRKCFSTSFKTLYSTFTHRSNENSKNCSNLFLKFELKRAFYWIDTTVDLLSTLCSEMTGISRRQFNLLWNWPLSFSNQEPTL